MDTVKSNPNKRYRKIGIATIAATVGAALVGGFFIGKESVDTPNNGKTHDQAQEAIYSSAEAFCVDQAGNAINEQFPVVTVGDVQNEETLQAALDSQIARRENGAKVAQESFDACMQSEFSEKSAALQQRAEDTNVMQLIENNAVVTETTVQG